MKKTSITVMLLILTLLVSACGGSNNNSASKSENGGTNGAGGEKVTLSLYSTASDGSSQEVLKKVIADYQVENPNVNIEVQYPGADYDSVLKMMMASNELPDLFDTHGWAMTRYKDYVADLSGEAWTADLSDTIKNVLVDDTGKVYALPLNESKDGITFNANVLEKYGVEIPTTIDEMIAAGEKIKAESNGSVIPFFYAGQDSWTIGQFFDYFANSLLISPEPNQAQALLDNTFDWNNWNPLAEKFKELHDKGLMNEDVLTAKYSDIPALFAQDQIAFVMTGPAFTADALNLNPDLKFGIMPVPAMVEGDAPNFSGGERNTLAAWKDSKNLEEAKKFLAFYAKPEYMKMMAEATGSPAAFKSVTADLGQATQYYEQFKDIRVFPYFDRLYLPSGMWDVITTKGQEILAGGITAQDFSDAMKQNVDRLLSQQ
ncbi:ABC transporter substrate-binding protein [Paenibacillus sp. M1]|uniref:ABC transporter substrate-binding protein n=1 Tax=Paenibacillus haidiansis TaxID=1574488 RepID=A0ABU7VMK5_9BACL